ncbi:hypothetical protein ABR737_01295 [Streptomyces sp. Edi2]|uniref:hypothetical protein n=1 Tax=Streptomyces sp. Edi2 TaxID=3162528 RepID=UPI00330574EA
MSALEGAGRDLLRRLRAAQREPTGDTHDRIRGLFEADALDLLQAHIPLTGQEVHA